MFKKKLTIKIKPKIRKFKIYKLTSNLIQKNKLEKKITY